MLQRCFPRNSASTICKRQVDEIDRARIELLRPRPASDRLGRGAADRRTQELRRAGRRYALVAFNDRPVSPPIARR